MRRSLFVMVAALMVLGIWTGVGMAAGTGAEIPELTGAATDIFEGFRFTDYLSAVGLVMLGVAGIMVCYTHAGGGLIPLVTVLIGLGLWFQAEAIADAVNLTALVIG